MRFCSLKLVALVFFWLFFFSSASADENPYWKKAGELIQSGNLEEAIEEIDRHLVEMPDDVLLLRIKGVCFLKLGKLEQAENFSRKAVEVQPSNIAANFYLANALAGQGNIPEAIDLLVFIKDTAPESPYAEKAEELLPQLRSFETNLRPTDKKKKWNLYLGLSNEYDSNVPARSRHQKNTVTDSYRTASSGVFEYRFIDQDIDAIGLTLGARHSSYYSWHQKRKFSDYDLAVNSSDLILARSGRLISFPYKLKLEGGYTNTRLGSKRYSHAAKLGSDLAVEWNKRATLIPKYSLVWEDFKYTGADPGKYSLSGRTHCFGLDHYLRMLKDKVVWGLGYEYRVADTKGSQFKRDAYNVFTSVNIALPQGMSLSSRVGYMNSSYTKYEPVPKRLDKVFRTSADLTCPLSEDILFLTLGYSYLQSESKVDFADYRRNVFRVSLDLYY